jgi:hypothetical protein
MRPCIYVCIDAKFRENQTKLFITHAFVIIQSTMWSTDFRGTRSPAPAPRLHCAGQAFRLHHQLAKRLQLLWFC